MKSDSERVQKIIRALKKEYPYAAIPLKHKNPLQLLIATILSAQCTDDRVNQVTPALFARYKTVTDFAGAKPQDLENLIMSTGFYKNKAKSIIGCSRGLIEKHGGKVPPSLDDLVKLPGIGRKTANVVLGACFGIPGIVVDTHVKRLSGRLNLAKDSDPEKIEREMMDIVPKKEWSLFSLLLILHGRQVCNARKPKCRDCVISKYCPSNEC